MKILLTNPPLYGSHFYGIRSGTRWPHYDNQTIESLRERLKERVDANYNPFPFYLAFLGAILKEQGNDIKVYDALALCHSYKEFYARVKAEAPDKIVIEPGIHSIEQDLQMLNNLKEMGIKTVICGAAVKHNLEKIKACKFIDEIWEGNYMETLLGEDYIKKLPAPIRDEETIYYYSDYVQFPQFIKRPQLQVWSSVGCPYNCNFCLWRWAFTMGKYKSRPVENVEKEIKDCLNRFNIKSILFDDDTFNVGDKHVKEYSKMMRTKVKLPWMAMVRADSCSVDAFKEMFDSGCNVLKVGVESFNPNTLKTINKGLTAECLKERVMQLVDIGFNVYLSAMNNIPKESPEDREMNKQILLELYKCGVRHQYPDCLPLPGTPLYDEFARFELKEYGDNLPDFEFGKYFTNRELKIRVNKFTNS